MGGVCVSNADRQSPRSYYTNALVVNRACGTGERVEYENRGTREYIAEAATIGSRPCIALADRGDESNEGRGVWIFRRAIQSLIIIIGESKRNIHSCLLLTSLPYIPQSIPSFNTLPFFIHYRKHVISVIREWPPTAPHFLTDRTKP